MKSNGCPGFHKIQDYGLIGDCRSAALVSKAGSIDWLCWPRFDSPAIFASLLDPDRGGCWSISPTAEFSVRRKYVGNSNVLETYFTCDSGAATLLDLMPVADEEFKHRTLVPDHELIRQIVCTEGQMQIAMDFYPRSSYGLKPLRFRNLGALGLRADCGRGAYWLRSNAPLEVGEDRVRARVTLRRGERLLFSLTYAEESPAVLSPLGETTLGCIERSVRWWQQWAQTCTYRGRYRDAVLRSALVLKLLSYAPSGAIIAAATTSLPELPGDHLNWDYRYCWLRDASFTIRAMLGLGYRAEAESFLTWLLHATRLTQPRLDVLYTVFGQLGPREREVHGLRGYCNSRPVRVGNDARHQLQLDIYGEVIDAATQYVAFGGRFDRVTQKVLIRFGKYVARHWNLPDEGIWEPRGNRQDHTYSRLLCWVALDRLLSLCQKGALQGAPVEEFRVQRERIREEIQQRGWSERQRSYVSILDGHDLDASLLRIPWYGFEPASSPRMRSTYRRIRDDLGAGQALLYRYSREPAEGAFGICGFWSAEYLAIGGGSVEEAREQFEQLLGFQNELGLFAEEIDPATGDALGNFPQAFTHLGLISAALSIEEREKGLPPVQRRHGHEPREVQV